jgi:hypothetical protein
MDACDPCAHRHCIDAHMVGHIRASAGVPMLHELDGRMLISVDAFMPVILRGFFLSAELR